MFANIASGSSASTEAAGTASGKRGRKKSSAAEEDARIQKEELEAGLGDAGGRVGDDVVIEKSNVLMV